jgi:hypothetical protein
MYRPEKFYATLIPFTPAGDSLEVEVDGYLYLFLGLPHEVKRALWRLKEYRYQPNEMHADDVELIDELRNLTRKAANRVAKQRIELPPWNPGDKPILFRACLANAGEGSYDPKAGEYRRDRR